MFLAGLASLLLIAVASKVEATTATSLLLSSHPLQIVLRGIIASARTVPSEVLCEYRGVSSHCIYSSTMVVIQIVILHK